MKVMLTGARGLLGSAVWDEFTRAGHQCTGLDRRLFERAAPRDVAPTLVGADVLIHAAANTNVEQCELDPDACYRDNSLLTETVARAAALAGVQMVYISSTGLYGSYQDDPYREYSDVQPPTHHHRAKRQGEIAALSQDARNLVVRTGWLFGGSVDNPKNFVARRLDEANTALAAGTRMSSNIEQRGVPTYTIDVAQRLLALVESGHAGIFNCVNQGSASRFDYVKAIIEKAGLVVPLIPTDGASFNRKARVSRNEMAINWRMHTLGFSPMPDWQDSLERYIHESALRTR